MKIKKIIMDVILRICRLFLIFTKIDENKITFLSLENDKLANDFKLIADELSNYPEYKLNFILVKFEKNLKGYIKYFFVCIKQFFAINTSKLVILDYNNFVVSNYKRKGVKVLQLWHASGAIKKFGNDVNRDYKIKNYDYVIANSDYFVDPFSKAFNVNPENIIVTGIPKTDRLFKKKTIKKFKSKLYKEYPMIKGKKVVVYAPTFRGRMGTNFELPKLDLEYVANQLGDDYVIVYKLHPLLDDVVNVHNDKVICMNNKSIHRLYSIADYLISDYSAVIIDYSIFNKPLILYAPDLETYKENVGLYIDYNKLPGVVCQNAKDVVNAISINNFNLDEMKQFRDEMFKYQDGKSTERVVKLINDIMKG